jgi:hypothetical protein
LTALAPGWEKLRKRGENGFHHPVGHHGNDMLPINDRAHLDLYVGADSGKYHACRVKPSAKKCLVAHRETV